MVKQCFLFVFVILHFGLFAQYDGGYAGGRQASMGGTAVNLQGGWSILNNPAGMGDAENILAGVFYETRYSMDKFNRRGAGFQLPTDIGAFGIAFSYYGYSVYNEKRFVLGYGRQLMPKLKGGVSFDYLHTHLEGNKMGKPTSNQGIITFQAGLQTDLSEKIQLGFSVFNPWSPKFSEYKNENIPAIARLGISYKPDEQFLLSFEAEQNSEHGLRIKSGIEYEIHEKLIARGGIKTNPSEYTFGVGTEFLGIKFNVAFAYHLVLGYSPHGDILYEFE